MIPSALRWGGFVGPVPKFAQKNGADVVTAFLTPLLKRWRRCRLLGRAKAPPPAPASQKPTPWPDFFLLHPHRGPQREEGAWS